jgi:hypothetical protein
VIFFKIFFYFFSKILNYTILLLDKLLNVIILILKIFVLITIGLYFGLKKILPKIPFMNRLYNNKLNKYLNLIMNGRKNKIDLVFDLDGTLIKTSKLY